MSTKDYCPKLQHFDADFISVNQETNQYKNINLNQNFKCENDVTLIKNKSNVSNYGRKDYEKFLYFSVALFCIFHSILRWGTAALNESKVYYKDSKLLKNDAIDSWKNNDNFEKLQSLNHFDPKNEKKWKKNFGESSFKNESKLSIHISIYKNSVETFPTFLQKTIDKTSKNIKSVFGNSAVGIQNPFEFPRQKESEPLKPELMQFKVSQTLLNPNEMLPPNIIYGHSFPRINENNNNTTTDHHQKDIIHHHFPQHHHPMFFVDGVWHRMPIAPFILPELPLLFPPPLLEDIFDYNNAIHIEADDDVLRKKIQLSEYGLRRLTSNEITEDDLAFLKSADKILCTMEESSIESPKESSPLLLSPPPSANSSNFSTIFLSSSPSLIPPSHSRKPTTTKRTSTRKSLFKSSPSKRAYRKSSATTTHYSNEHFPKLCTAASLPRPPRKQPPPLCVPSLDISRGFVGFCNVLKVNPYYAGCTGRVTTFKDEINHTYFVCANCGTRRRYMEKSNSNSSVLD